MKIVISAIAAMLMVSLCMADTWQGWITGPRRTSMSFSRTPQGKAYVLVELSGRKLRFLVDTGGATIVDIQIAKELGLTPVSAGDTTTTLLGNSGDRYVVTTDLTIDKFKLGKYPLTCLDLSFFKKQEQPELVGILGADLLTMFRAKIDYDTNELTLRRPKS